MGDLAPDMGLVAREMTVKKGAVDDEEFSKGAHGMFYSTTWHEPQDERSCAPSCLLQTFESRSGD
jgi:hypothetical protein